MTVYSLKKTMTNPVYIVKNSWLHRDYLKPLFRRWMLYNWRVGHAIIASRRFATLTSICLIESTFEPTDKIDDFKMGLCISVKRKDYEDIVRYDGGTLLCFKHGEGTNLYENGDIYKGQWRSVSRVAKIVYLQNQWWFIDITEHVYSNKVAIKMPQVT